MELTVLIALIASLSAFATTIFAQMRLSKCSSITCCWGCLDLERDTSSQKGDEKPDIEAPSTEGDLRPKTEERKVQM